MIFNFLDDLKLTILHQKFAKKLSWIGECFRKIPYLGSNGVILNHFGPKMGHFESKMGQIEHLNGTN